MNLSKANLTRLVFSLIFCLVFSACKESASGDKAGPAAEDAAVQATVPVKTARVTSGPLSSFIELNASSVFLKKNELRSTATGYIQAINIQLGDQAGKGKILFTLKTKEASVLGNNLFPNDSSLKFSGLIPIKASQSGYVTAISRQIGDYVQEGDSMCTIADLNSLVFLVNVPFEYNQKFRAGMKVDILLADGRRLQGTVGKKLAIMDAGSQTESFIVNTPLASPLPENLLARVRFADVMKTQAIIVPRSALLSNEEQTEYWVMQTRDLKTATRLNVKKGIENAGEVELLESGLKPGDLVLASGNYGLGDTARIKLIP